MVNFNTSSFGSENPSLISATEVNDTSNLYLSNVSVFGKEAWEKYFGNFKIEDEIPELPEEVYDAVRTINQNLTGESHKLSCTVILMPKGLSLHELKKHVRYPIIGYSSSFHFIWDQADTILGHAPIKEPYWLVVTNDIIDGSATLNYDGQKELIQNCVGSEWKLPTMLEAITCCVMHRVSSGNYLLVRPHFTHCQESIDGDPVVVGGPRGGFIVSSNRLLTHPYDNDFVCSSNTIGAQVCRKFC